MDGKKTAVIITCFDTYEKRMLAVEKQLQARGFEVIAIESDFLHLQRERRTDHRENLIFIHTIAYRRNLSLTRIYSHYRFSKAALKVASSYQPDLLYILVPPNSLVKGAADYKKQHPGVKVIFDVLDLWPETLPMKKVEMLPPYACWRGLREKYIGCADHIFTECNLFHDLIAEGVPAGKISTLYLCRPVGPFQSHSDLDEEEIGLAYLGSINNIIDIPRICRLVKALTAEKPVTVHVVGNGEKKDIFLNELERAGAKVEFYGELYDKAEKQKIFDRCHFGINILKDTVCIGLTMKSVDYFECGLPVINTIGGDTAELIDGYRVGIPYQETAEATARLILASLKGDCLAMRQNSRALFETQFSLSHFEDVFTQGMAFLKE